MSLPSEVRDVRSLRGRMKKYFQTGILVRVTNMGLGFILMTLIIAIAATNTGNNGLYTLVSLFLSALIVSGLVSRWNVDRIGAVLDGPPEVFASEPARFTLSLTNLGRLPRRALLVKISGAAAPLLFGEILRGEVASRSVDLIFPKRGRRSVESLLVYSGYPIGLFRKGRLHPMTDQRIVFPAPIAMEAVRPDGSPFDLGDPRMRRRGRGQEVRHLREGSARDDPRDVHWPQTARQGQLILKERSAEDGRDAFVLLDARRPSDAVPGWPADFERAVSETTGLALALLARGDRVGLAIHGGSWIQPGSGPGHRNLLLTALALAEAASGLEPDPRIPPRTTLFRVTARAGAAAAAA
ncbi:MAG: DUF58 domain-containing protein [Thermoanaerobaculia bacterium]